MDLDREQVQADAVAVAHRVIWATVSTVDALGRPRVRVMHPVWALGEHGLVGWATSRRTPVKVRHLAANPHVTCAYLATDHDAAFFDCVATWAEGAERREAWDACLATPAPAGFDPATIFPAGPDDAAFSALRLVPWRVQVLHGAAMARGERPRSWRAGTAARSVPG